MSEKISERSFEGIYGGHAQWILVTKGLIVKPSVWNVREIVAPFEMPSRTPTMKYHREPIRTVPDSCKIPLVPKVHEPSAQSMNKELFAFHRPPLHYHVESDQRVDTMKRKT